jgi:ribosome biogenesis GTPase / thiamine phosphate phosphatase
VRCHFRDCSHTVEKPCAVLEALAAGTLPRDRYESYLKLARELDYLAKERKQHTYLARQRQARLAQGASSRWKGGLLDQG